MNEEKVREWIKQKLDQGVEEQRIRKVLREKDYPASIVDEVKQNRQNTVLQNENKKDLGREKPSDFNQSKKLDKQQKSKTPKLREKVSNISKSLENSFNRFWKPALSLTVLIIVLVSAWMFFPVNGLTNSVNELIGQNTDSIPSEVENRSDYSVEVIFKNRVAQPSSPEITTNENVKFVNTENYSLTLSFERNIQDFKLGPEKSKTVDIDEVVYFEATPENSGNQKINGVIRVQ